MASAEIKTDVIMKLAVMLARSLFWSIILGTAVGIFGVTLSVARIADFYLKEGATKTDKFFTIRIIPSSAKPLTKDSLAELNNIEGSARILPHFTPEELAEGSIGYFGFEAKYSVRLKGIPETCGADMAYLEYKKEWSSTSLDNISVLIPQQAINLYNNIAPSRGWPVLQESSFLGIPGVALTIMGSKYDAIITGFDSQEFGAVVSVPAEKLYAIYEAKGLNPSYNFIDIQTVEGMTKRNLAKMKTSIELLGYKIQTDNVESLQNKTFQKLKQIFLILGISVLCAFGLLKTSANLNYYRQFQIAIQHYKLWGIPNYTEVSIICLSLTFSLLCSIFAWFLNFFIVIPVQDSLINTVTQFGINTPELKLSAQIALQAGILGASLNFIIDIGTLIKFNFSIPKLSSNRFQ